MISSRARDDMLEHYAVMNGMREFANVFEGELATETMMIQALNDGDEEAERIANFLAELGLIRRTWRTPREPRRRAG